MRLGVPPRLIASPRPAVFRHSYLADGHREVEEQLSSEVEAIGLVASPLRRVLLERNGMLAQEFESMAGDVLTDLGGLRLQRQPKARDEEARFDRRAPLEVAAISVNCRGRKS